MYAHNGNVEEISYSQAHIDKIIKEINKQFPIYFKKFLETQAAKLPSDEAFAALQDKFKVTSSSKKSTVQKLRDNFVAIIVNGKDEFDKDREKYKNIFDEEILEDYDYDANSFKSKILKSECPIIRKTLNNKKAKELDKYRLNFRISAADDLLKVVKNLCDFCHSYHEKYDSALYDKISNYHDLEMKALDEEQYTAYGVIGGGIKSHMLYKVYPDVFANRSRDALWALWYLSNYSDADMHMGSEFLMIDVEENVTQQNYFYPYELFMYYAYVVYKLLQEQAQLYNVKLDEDYRYVLVDQFFDFVALQHENDIAELKRKIRDGGLGYA